LESVPHANPRTVDEALPSEVMFPFNVMVEVETSVGTEVVMVDVAGMVHVGTVIVFVSAVTVELNAKSLPKIFAKCPNVMLKPSASPRKIFPTKVGVVVAKALAPIVVAPTGIQNTSQADAPPVNTTVELAAESRAPPDLKMYVP